jgi:hypothetical protein
MVEPAAAEIVTVLVAMESELPPIGLNVGVASCCCCPGGGVAVAVAVAAGAAVEVAVAVAVGVAVAVAVGVAGGGVAVLGGAGEPESPVQKKVATPTCESRVEKLCRDSKTDTFLPPPKPRPLRRANLPRF